MKGRLVSWCLLCCASGCDGSYIVKMDDIVRYNQMSERAQEKGYLFASREEDVAQAKREGREPDRVAVSANRLKFDHGTWIDGTRMRVPVKRPIELFVLGGILVGGGIALAAMAGRTHADHTCEQMTSAGDFRGGECFGRDITALLYGLFGSAVGVPGLGVIFGGAIHWSPELTEPAKMKPAGRAF